MPISLSTPEGKSVAIDEPVMPETVAENVSAFERANGAQLSEDEKLRPPKRVDKTDPGYTPNPDPVEKPRRGRPKKEDPAEKSRTTKAAPKEPLAPKDFTKGLTDVTDAIWMGTGMLPVPASQMTSVILKANQEGIVATLNAGAQTNRAVRKVVEKVTGDGGAGNMWILSLGMLGYGMYMQAQALSNDPALFAQVVEANNQAVQLHMQQVFGLPQEQAA